MDIWIWGIIKWIFTIIGHLGIWAAAYNHVHATAWPRRHRKISETAVIFVVLLPMIWVLTILFDRRTISFELIRHVSSIAYFYGIGCQLVACFFVARWLWRNVTSKKPESLISQSSELVDVRKSVSAPLLHGLSTKLLDMVPGNQSTQLSIDSRTLALSNCPAELHGLKFCHLSDLHFTGRLGQEYFQEVVNRANEFDPDLIFITGDLIDHAKCVEWIEKVLGKLHAKHGVFYVLGNHDRRIFDEQLLRTTLKENGLSSAATGKWIDIEINGARVLLAGNDMPWYLGAKSLPFEPEKNPADLKTLKILISHSPDQLDWAKDYLFDLMLAGHTHGGQIRFPVIGPVVAPSKYGVKYCSGTFEIGKMLLHVSRGISGDDLIRINCPPELGLFTLDASQAN